MPKLIINGRFLLQSVTGVQRVALEFCNALEDMRREGFYGDLDVSILCPVKGDFVGLPSYRTIEVRRAGRFTGHAWEQLELGRLAGDADLLCLGNVAPVERLIRRTGRTFTMVHDLSYQYFPSAYSLGFRAFYSAVIPLVLSRSDAVFTVSETERKAILKHHGKRISVDRLHAVQNGAIRKGSEAGVAPPLPPDQREPFVLYVGSLTLRKNAPRLIQACIELARQTDLDFVFIGATGASFGALNISLPEDLKSRFHFLGQINDSRVIYDHLSRASLFLFPSLYEASPLPPIEAMAFGCPVVAGRIPSLLERCGDAAEFCDSEDVGSIVATALAVLNNPERRLQLSRAGRERADRYSWENQVDSVLTIAGYRK